MTAVLALALAFASAAFGAVPPASAASWGDPIAVYLDGQAVAFDVPPLLTPTGRTLVPFRLLAEALGAKVDYFAQNRQVSAWMDTDQGRRTVELYVDNTQAYVNGQAVTLDVPAMVVDGRTLVPLRFFGEALGAAVTWHADTRTIDVTRIKAPAPPDEPTPPTPASEPVPMEVLGYYALGGRDASSWQDLFGLPYPNTDTGATDIVSTVTCAWFVLDPTTGALRTDDRKSSQTRPDDWESILDACDEYGLATEMMVLYAPGSTDIGVTPDFFYAFLSDERLQETAVDEILSYAEDFDGVNLDLESFGNRLTGDELAGVRNDFTAFVSLLSEALHNEGKTLTLSLNAPNSYYLGHDWAALGPLADRLVLMAYIYQRSAPQPMAKVTEAVDMALQAVDADKVLLAVITEWETPETLAEKIALAEDRGLAGIALWHLGTVGEERWDVMRRFISPRGAKE